MVAEWEITTLIIMLGIFGTIISVGILYYIFSKESKQKRKIREYKNKIILLELKKKIKELKK
jgi:hypothetical protein